jgi:hypothetical protein
LEERQGNKYGVNSSQEGDTSHVRRGDTNTHTQIHTKASLLTATRAQNERMSEATTPIYITLSKYREHNDHSIVKGRHITFLGNTSAYHIARLFFAIIRIMHFRIKYERMPTSVSAMIQSKTEREKGKVRKPGKDVEGLQSQSGPQQIIVKRFAPTHKFEHVELLK